jgi:UrcA family protein
MSWVESTTMINIAKSALIAAGALGLMLTAASAQEYGGPGYDAPPPPPDYGSAGPYDDNSGPPPPDAYGPPPSDAYGPPPESVIVIAPPRADRSSLAPTEITRLSTNVAYSDLDLRTYAGAHELRARVRDAARDVCGQLVARFPHALYDTTSCYKQALYSGLNRADTAIGNARHYAYYEGRE